MYWWSKTTASGRLTNHGRQTISSHQIAAALEQNPRNFLNYYRIDILTNQQSSLHPNGMQIRIWYCWSGFVSTLRNQVSFEIRQLNFHRRRLVEGHQFAPRILQ